MTTAPLHTSPAGIALIKRWEGLRLAAYQDAAGVWTIGYGHTGGVRAGDTVTAQQAETMLMTDIAAAERDVRAAVTVPLTHGQWDALVSWTFNLGGYRLRDSTLLRRLNAGDYDGAATEFGRWIRSGSTVLPGLVSRRQDEVALFRAGAGAADAPGDAGATIAGGPAPADGAVAHEAPAAPPAPGVASAVAPVGAPVVELSTTARPEDVAAAIAERSPSPATPAPSAQPRPPHSIEDPVMPIPAFVIAALPALVAAIPELAKLFGSGSEVAERNIRAAEVAVRIAQQATGAANAQDTAERIAADPIAAQAARDAVRAHFFELVEVAGGIAAARDYTAAADPLPRIGLRFHEILTLLVVTGAYAIGGLYLFTGSPAPEMAAALVTALVISSLGAIGAFWFGSTSGSQHKSDLLARK